MIALVLMGLFMACGVDNKYNTYYPVNFVFFTNIYPTSALTRAVESPGMFCIVKPSSERGVTHLKLTPNQGKWEATDLDLVMNTAIGNEKLSYNNMGAGKGLIIGHSNAFGLKAFDLQCPNCFNPNALPLRNHTLTVSGTGIASCKDCHREYNLNTGGNIVAGDTGTMLKPYRASNTGPNGLLRVY